MGWPEAQYAPILEIFLQKHLQFSGGVNAVTDEYPQLILRSDFISVKA
jgi:hypothetical protein